MRCWVLDAKGSSQIFWSSSDTTLVSLGMGHDLWNDKYSLHQLNKNHLNIFLFMRQVQKALVTFKINLWVFETMCLSILPSLGSNENFHYLNFSSYWQLFLRTNNIIKLVSISINVKPKWLKLSPCSFYLLNKVFIFIPPFTLQACLFLTWNILYF